MKEEEPELCQIYDLLIDLRDDIGNLMAEIRQVKAKVERIHWKKEEK